MGKTSRRRLLQGAAALGATSALLPRAVFAANNPAQIGVVGKVKIPWFDNVAKGVEKAGSDLGVTASIINPTTDDPAEQVRAIEDLIAKKVDAIGLLPLDVKVLAPVLKRAREAGIVVITQEGPNQDEKTWDVEMIDSTDYGETQIKTLAREIGEEGD